MFYAFKNQDISRIVLRKVRISTLSASSGVIQDNSRIAQGVYIVLMSNLVCTQSRNRRGQSKHLKSENSPDMFQRFKNTMRVTWFIVGIPVRFYCSFCKIWCLSTVVQLDLISKKFYHEYQSR